MAGNLLTGGFDLCLQFSKNGIGKFFSAFYNMGLIPSLVTRPVNGHTLELYLDVPQVSDLGCIGNLQWITIRMPVIVRVVDEPVEYTGTLFFKLRLSKVYRTLPTGEVSYVEATFDEQTIPDPYELAMNQETPYNQIISDTLLNTIREKLKFLPITPLIPESGGESEESIIAGWYFHVYDRQHLIIPGSYLGSPDAVEPVLGMFIRLKPNPTDNDIVNLVMPAYFVHQYGPQYAYVLDSADYTIGLPSDTVQAGLNQAVAEKNLPMDIPEEGVTLESLSLALGNYHIRFWGTATKTITADFQGDAKLSIANGQLSVYDDKLDVDVPDWLKALGFFLGAVGTIILIAVKRGVESVTAGGLSFDLDQLDMFNDFFDTPADPTGTLPTIQITNGGDIQITPEGFVIAGNMNITVEQVEIYKPKYFLGHIYNKEFHEVSCKFAKKIKPNRGVLFYNEKHAWDAGYNGCAYCCAEYDRTEAGNLLMHFLVPGQVPGAEVEFEYTFSLKPVVLTGKRGSKDSLVRTYKNKKKVDKEGNYLDLFTVNGLMAGIWKMEMSCGSWKSTTNKTIYGDRTRKLAFYYNDGCKPY